MRWPIGASRTLAFQSTFKRLPRVQVGGPSRINHHHTSGDWAVPRAVQNEQDLHRAASVLNAGRKIAVMAGAGARGAREELEQIAEPKVAMQEIMDAVKAEVKKD